MTIIKFINFRYFSTSFLRRNKPDLEVVNNDKSVVIEKLGAVTTIGLNRPQSRNSINVETLKILNKAISEFENDDSAQLAILYGIGGNFCSGYDLKEIEQHEVKIGELFEEYRSLSGFMTRFISKPLIAGISGYAVGSGMELALMCDFRVMEETAVMGFLNRRFGVPLINGGTVRLPVMVGYSKALDLIGTGRGVTGKEALEWGLTTRLVACGTALGQSLSLASSILKFPQKCLNMDRVALYHNTFTAKSFEDAADVEQNSINDDVLKESVLGAKKFLRGIGKNGKFYNIHERYKKDWEDE